ncbi:MAG: DUF1844 domain-containing protein [Tepidisphaera sp.]|jgi:hypothetical protein
MSIPPPPGDEPKLIIDSDWKAQAQAEKDRLAAANKPKPAAPAAGPGAEATGETIEDKLGFQDLVSLFATQALTYMGAIPDPRSGKGIVAPEYARLYIDMLGVLREKTKGNLTEDEQKLIDQTLGELRSEFVELVKAVERAVAEGKIKPQQMGGMGGIGGGAGGVVVPPAGGMGGGMGGGAAGGGFGGGQIFGS